MDPKIKWKTLEHNGVAFPPDYQGNELTISINSEMIILNREQEEVIYAWAKKKDTHYVKDQIFQENFLVDLKKLLPEKFNNIKNISEIDFSQVFKFVDQEQLEKLREKERIKNLSREEKKKITLLKKQEKEKLKEIYGRAIVDGIKVDIANWLVEPPGLFMGRGLHPLRGKWKPRVTQQDVTLNLGEDAPVPEGAWGGIIHDHASTWLATWIEKLTGKRKYVWLHDSATLKQNKDKEKYDKAKNLEKYFHKVEKEIINKMSNSKDVNKKKIATVCYLILKLAMRVGDEKDPDEADTVGASTLRVEHVKLEAPDLIIFDFLGKDSIKFHKEIKAPTSIYDNFV
ncbi:MAG: DNA topoisomerase I, partial [Nitrososphaeraceae archaeon]